MRHLQQHKCLATISFILMTVVFQLVSAVDQGDMQPISINDFSKNDSPALGMGYYLQGVQKKSVSVLYGVDAFSLTPTTYEASLSEQYSRISYPIYLATKILLHSGSQYDLTVDAGVGPNIMSDSDFSKSTLDNIATPEHIFSGGMPSNTIVALSATAGFGVRINQALTTSPLEIDYRFFYLGQGNSAIANRNYANALFLSLSF